MRLLTYTPNRHEVTVVGQTHTVYNDLAWCATPGYEQYIAGAGQDCTLQLWDMDPPEGPPRCFTRPLDAPVQTVAFHTKVPKLLLTVEASGVGRLIDWLATIAPGVHTVQSAAAFAEPHAAAAFATQHTPTPGRAAWQAQDPDTIGALLGSRWSVWNVGAQSAQPTRPMTTGVLSAGALPSAGHFAFCPTNARLFAVAVPGVSPALLAQSGYVAAPSGTSTYAAVQLYDSAFPQSPQKIDIHKQTPSVPDSVDLDTTGTSDPPTLPRAYSVASVDWLPHRIGPYDVLLVAIGTRIVPIPARAL